jgi:hypothetical protein
MTSPNDPWSNPAGQQAPQPGQYGQQPQYGPPQYDQYGAPTGSQPTQPQYGPPTGGQPAQYGPPSGGQQAQPQYGQYGQPLAGPPQYGQQPAPFGSPQFADQYNAGYGPYGQPGGPKPSSGALITAGVVQIVQSALWVIVGIVVIAAASALNDILDEAGVGSSSSDDLTAAAIVIGLIILAVAITMIVLAAKMMRRSNGCRIASIVMQIIFGVVYLIGIIGAASDSSNPAFAVVFLLSCALVVGLLFTASAKAAVGANR